MGSTMRFGAMGRGPGERFAALVGFALALILALLVGGCDDAGVGSASELEKISSRLERVERVNQYLSDVLAIHKVQNLYQHYININARRDIVALFSDRPDVEIELSNKGVLVGSDAPERYFLWQGTEREITEDHPPRPAGALIMHFAINPALEISKDGKRAHAVWMSPGITTSPNKDGEIIDAWNWGKYEMEYVKEEGEWKILTFRWHQIFYAEYGQGWAGDQRDPGFRAFPLEADRLSDADFYNPYGVDKINVFKPFPPAPYED